MKVGIDFDRVIFNTDKFNQYLKKETGLHHVEENIYNENGCYSVEKHAEACGIEVEEVFNAMRNLNRFLYPDVDELRKLKPDNKLIIVTRGEKKFQAMKIENSGAKNLFDDLYIVQGASKDITDIDLLIDDRKEELENVDIQGMLFDREKHGTKDIINKVKSIET